MRSSEKLNELFGGMFLLKKDLIQPKFDVKVDYTTKKEQRIKYEYASLKVVIETIRTASMKSESGIDFQQDVSTENGSVNVYTMVTHVSGQFIKYGPLSFPIASNDPQSIGSLITYARRYAITSIFGIATDKDDDGSIASDNVQEDLDVPEMTLIEAKKMVITFGRHSGKELGEIVKEDESYLDWLIKNAKQESLKKAAYMVLYPEDNKQSNDESGLITKDQEDEIMNLVNVLGQAVGKSPDEVLIAYKAQRLDKFDKKTADDFITTLSESINDKIPSAQEEQTQLFYDRNINNVEKNNTKNEIPWGQKR